MERLKRKQLVLPPRAPSGDHQHLRKQSSNLNLQQRGPTPNLMRQGSYDQPKTLKNDASRLLGQKQQQPVAVIHDLKLGN